MTKENLESFPPPPLEDPKLARKVRRHLGMRYQVDPPPFAPLTMKVFEQLEITADELIDRYPNESVFQLKNIDLLSKMAVKTVVMGAVGSVEIPISAAKRFVHHLEFG